MSDTTNEPLILNYGRRTYPDDVQAVWGARLIWPNDLLWDRQDVRSHTVEARSALIAWLNGPNSGDGAIHKMKEILSLPEGIGLTWNGEQEAVIYEDEVGKIIGSAQGSCGYVYVAAWLK